MQFLNVESRVGVVFFIRDKGNRGVFFCSILFNSSIFISNKNIGFYRNYELALDTYFEYT